MRIKKITRKGGFFYLEIGVPKWISFLNF